jgi:hypothetical protein
LLRKLFPEMSDEQLLAMLKKRGTKNVPESLLADRDNLDVAGGVFDSGDHKEVKTMGTEGENRRIEHKSLKSFLTHKFGSHDLDMDDKPACAVGLGKKKAASGPNAVLNKPPLGMDFVAAKKMLPKVKGCILQPYEHLSSAQIYYSTTMPPYSRQWSWSADGPISRRQVMVACLTWAWGKDTESTGEPCPYDLSEGLAMAG